MFLQEILQGYFNLERSGEALLQASYDPLLVLLSIVVAFFASFTTLKLVDEMQHEYQQGNRASRYWWMGAAVTLGGGIFMMHFIGMLAYAIPVDFTYDFGLTLFSLLVAVVVSLFALAQIRSPAIRLGRVVIGGVIMGIGVAMMHYIGMAAILAPALLRYAPGLWVLSIVVAITAAIVGLLLLHYTPRRKGVLVLGIRIAVASVIAAAIAGMHYIGMAAAEFYSGGYCGISTGLFGLRLEQQEMGMMLAIVALAVFGIALTTSSINDRFNAILVQKNRELEQRVARRTHELEQSLAKNESLLNERTEILNASPMGICLTDKAGKFILTNPAMSKIFGYREEELVGQMVEFLVPEGKRHSHIQYRDHYWAVNDSRQMGEREVLIEGQHKDGSLVPLSIGLTPMEMHGAACTLVTVVDITEQRRAEMAKDDFLASMSHEQRTPLTAIIGNCELLLEKSHDQETESLIRSIEHAGRVQLALVNDILDLSKVEMGKFTIDETPFDLSMLLYDMECMFSMYASESGLAFEIEQKNNEAYRLVGDSQRIAQILINLIGNAIKFTERGKVVLTTEVRKGRLLFSIEDTGIGMSQAVLDRLFQRFEQADNTISRRFGGSGLGLYISQRLAGLMDGTIEASSREGEGATFRLSLPYSISDLPLVKAEQHTTVTAMPDTKLSGHVLVVEDTPELQLLERRLLERMGVTVSIAENGLEAVDQATEHSFDLILMDMQMPEMDGIEATRRLRAEGNRVPIVALTANVMQKHRDAFYEAGCDGFLSKPVNLVQLRTELAKYIKTSIVESADIVVDPVQSVQSVTFADDELMKLFLERMHVLKLSLSTALANEDWGEAREIAHVIRGSAASFGHSDLSRLGALVCDAYEREDMDSLSELVMDLLFKISSILH